MSKSLILGLVGCLMLAAGPAAADFCIDGAAGGSGLDDPGSIVYSDVASPGGFVVTGTGHGDDTDVRFHLRGAHGEPSLTWTNDLHFRADAATGEIGAALLTHTDAPGPGRSGASAMIDVWMWDMFHVDPGPGVSPGEAVDVDLRAAWDGHILLEGSPNSGAHVEYRARFFLGSGGWYGPLLAELISISPNLYPPMDETVSRSLNQRVTVSAGDVISVHQYITFDLNGSAYSGDTIPSGDNNLDFLDTGWAGVGYSPDYEHLNIWSDAGAPVAPLPGSFALLATGSAVLAARRHARKPKV